MDNKTITRRVDESGNILIPEEFRKALNLFPNSKIELSILNDNELLITKSRDMDNILEYLTPIVNALSDTIEHDCLITDLDRILVSNKKKYLNKSLSSAVQDLILTKQTTIKKSNDDSEMIEIILDLNTEYNCELIVPIISNESVVGSIIVLSPTDDQSFDSAIRPCIAFSKYIGNKII